MSKLKTSFMNQHPLRKKLKQEDWSRIQAVMDGDLPDDQATADEFDAAHDVFYDFIAGQSQTHLGVTTLQ